MTASTNNNLGKIVATAMEGKVVVQVDTSISDHNYKNYGSNNRIEEQLGRRCRYWIQVLQGAEWS